jgi:hypothetical protein
MLICFNLVYARHVYVPVPCQGLDAQSSYGMAELQIFHSLWFKQGKGAYNDGQSLL